MVRADRLIVLQQHASKLLNCQLYESAEKLLGLHVSSPVGEGAEGEDSVQRARLFEMYADAIFMQDNFRRALHHYTQAMTIRKQCSGGKLVSNSNGVLIQSPAEATLRLKECRCHVRLKVMMMT